MIADQILHAAVARALELIRDGLHIEARVVLGVGQNAAALVMAGQS